MIRITDTLSIDEREIEESFVRASGPGGQNVNKLSTAVQLRFDVARSPSLPEDVRARLVRLAGRRLSTDGVLTIVAESHRSQRVNRDEALERLVDLIRRATIRPRPRRPTRPTMASKRRRMDSKTRRGNVKRLRQGRPDD